MFFVLVHAAKRYGATFMGPAIVVASIAALYKPSWFAWLASHITAFLSIIMFGMGMTLRWEDFRVVFMRPRDIAIGAGLQFTVMPGLAYLLARIFDLPPELAVGVILVGAAPGGTASNVLTYIAGGDVPLSVGMTIVSTLLALLVTPVLVWLLGGVWVPVDPVGMIVSIAQIVLVPVGLGLLCHRFFKRQTELLAGGLPFVSAIAIIIVVSGIIAVNAEHIRSASLSIFCVIVLHNLGGLCIGYAAAWSLGLSSGKCRAMGIEVGTQNSGLATALAYAHFSSAAGVAGALFSVWQNVAGSLLAVFFQRRYATQDRRKYWREPV